MDVINWVHSKNKGRSFTGIINSEIQELSWRCVSNMMKARFQFVYGRLSVIKYELHDWVYHYFSLICHSCHLSCDCTVFFLKMYVTWQCNTTFYCLKCISKRYLKDNYNYMFRLSFLSHLQTVTLWIFWYTIDIFSSTRSRLNKFKF